MFKINKREYIFEHKTLCQLKASSCTSLKLARYIALMRINKNKNNNINRSFSQ